MLAGFRFMKVYLIQQCSRGTNTNIIEYSELEEKAKIESSLKDALCVIEKALATYESRINVDAAIVSNGTIWLEGTNKTSTKHVIIPCK